MKIKPSTLPGNVVMEVGDHDSERLSKSGGASPFTLKTILVPVDFSNCSKKALQYAVPFAKQFDATIVLLHVVPQHCAVDKKSCEVDYEPELESGLRDNAAQQLKELAQKFVPRGVPVRIETCLGAEAVEIACAAKRLAADLIVISTHGRTGRPHALAGSVTETLVQLAPCPALVVREHEHDFVRDENANPFSRLPDDN